MTDPTNDTDIDALLKAIDPNKGNRPRWDNWETVIFAAECTRYHRAITALVAERDALKQRVAELEAPILNPLSSALELKLEQTLAAMRKGESDGK